MPIAHLAHDWRERHLAQFFRERTAAPFEWGSNDCALFACDAILAYTGVDIAADFRGQYTTQLGALRAIRTIADGETIGDGLAWCCAKHGLAEREHPLMAQRGDLVLCQQADGSELAAIVHLSGAHCVAPSENGLVRMPITSVRRCWTVPVASGVRRERASA